jgi:hypothetical protein
VSGGILRQNPTIVRLGALLLAASLVLFALNVGKILSHAFRPKLQPFPAGASH